MAFPAWFQQAVQQRLDHLAAQLEHHPELKQHRKEEKAACQTMITGIGDMPNPAFLEWEDKAHLARAMENEHMYLEGMRDGMQLITEILTVSSLANESNSASQMPASGRSENQDKQ